MNRSFRAVFVALLALAPYAAAGDAPSAPAPAAAPATTAASPAKTAAKKTSSDKPAHRISRAEFAQALADYPDLVEQAFLKIDKVKFFQFVIDSQKAAQADQEKKELDAAIANPFSPKIDAKTRIRGDKDAPITLVEYSDFECPYCGKGFRVVEKLRDQYGKKLRFIYKNMPLVNLHPQAMPAARWLEAVAIQSPEKAWLFHDQMFENQEKLGDAKTADEFFHKTVKDLGLDDKKAEKDAASAAVQAKIDADSKEAQEFGFTGTPGFLVNGVAVRGAYPPQYFDMLISRLGLNN